MVFWLGIASIVFFYVLIIGVGFWAARKSKNRAEGTEESEDLMVAGRDIGLVVGIFTMTATWVGGGYINGTAEVISDPLQGLIWCQAPVGYALSLIFGGIFFAGKMREQGYVTMLDPFQKKYGERMGGLLFIPALMGEVFWSAAILSALGGTINVIFNLNDLYSIVISAVIAVAYTMFGGLYAVAYTDVIQLFCIFVGLWVSAPFALANKYVQPISNTTSLWVGKPLPPSQISGYIDSALMLMFGGIPWQVYFQRVLSSRSSHRAQMLSYMASAGCIIMAIPAVLIGAAAASADWNATGYDGVKNGTLTKDELRKVLPLVLRWLCPEIVGMIGLGAVSAAVMSSADSSILSAASMFARNVFKSIFYQKASDRMIIWIMRISVFVIGALACYLGITNKSIYDLWFLCSDLVYVIIFPQLICVVYVTWSNTYGSLTGYIVGFVLRMMIGEKAFGMSPLLPVFDAQGNQLFPLKTSCMLISLITILLFSYLMHWLFINNKISVDKFDVFNCYKKLEIDPAHMDQLALAEPTSPNHSLDQQAPVDNEEVVSRILAKRMSFKRYASSSIDSQGIHTSPQGSIKNRHNKHRNSGHSKLNKTALDLVENARSEISKNDGNNLNQTSPDSSNNCSPEKTNIIKTKM